ncbi:MAG: transglutaminase-like domain-containing protein [Anaerolineae bacterium]
MRENVPGEFQVIEYGVKSFWGDWRSMDYGDPDSPRMVELRQEFYLEKVVEGAASEFEGFLALKRWVRSRWNHGWCRTDAKDGLDILREAAQGKQFQCGHFAITYVDCARALGWPARVTGISIERCEYPRDYQIGNVGHAIVEIWSNELEKWVVMDPDLNVYYVHDGAPLNALEIRDAWLSGHADHVEMVQDEPAFVMPSGQYTVDLLQEEAPYRQWSEEVVRLMLERFARHRAIDYYARVTANGWEYVDGRALPTFVSHFGPKGVKPTANSDDLYWSLNMVRLAAKPTWDEQGSRLAITLEHCMPWFHHYEARIDREQWQPVEASFVWPMREGINTLECRAVNVRNRPGIVSSMVVAHAKHQL